MNPIVLVTGCSSGIGRACAQRFAGRGWQVAATLRNPADADALADLPGVRVLALDVTDPASIATAVAAVEAEFGRLDVLVNNAGFGAFGPFETASRELIARQFATNVTGLMDVTRAVLPLMRRQRSGTIVNIASIGGLTTLPLNSIYHATKFAVVGFTEALHYELAPLGIRARFVAPGGVATDFAGRSLSRTFDPAAADNPYAATIAGVTRAFLQRSGNYASVDEVAEVVLRAATDPGTQVRWVVGPDAEALLTARAQLGEAGYLKMMMQRFGIEA